MIKVLSVADEPTFVLDTNFYEPINIEWKSPPQNLHFLEIAGSRDSLADILTGCDARVLGSAVVRS
jgi:hypothetical protein